MKPMISLLSGILLTAPMLLPAEPLKISPMMQRPNPDAQSNEIDSIVAIVNSDVITRQELKDRTGIVIQQLRKQGTPLPAMHVLEKQILERMIMDMLQTQYAAESGLRVDEAQLDMAITRIAQQNNFASLSDFRARLQADGVDFKRFREEIRSEIISTRLREREVESKLVITDNEVDNYLANQDKTGAKGEEYMLAHILVVVPEQANSEQIQQARDKAQQAWVQLENAVEFAQVAAAVSDAPDALKGGSLGWRPTERIPPLFMRELSKLQLGQHTQVLRSPNGFHILKLMNKRSSTGPEMVTQTRTRHILIKTSPTVSALDAEKRIRSLRRQLDEGKDFADLARLNSEDGSAAQGGDLDWVSPGQTVPEFENEMNRLQVNEVGMVQTQFGWHLIQVLERRSADVGDQQKRQRARMAIGSIKSDESYQDWLRQLRDRAFVEYRLESQ